MTTYYIGWDGDDTNDGLTWKTRRKTVTADMAGEENIIYWGAPKHAIATYRINERLHTVDIVPLPGKEMELAKYLAREFADEFQTFEDALTYLMEHGHG